MSLFFRLRLVEEPAGALVVGVVGFVLVDGLDGGDSGGRVAAAATEGFGNAATR